MLTRIVILLLAVLLLAAAIFGIAVIKRQLSASTASKEASSGDEAETVEMTPNGPFSLHIVSKKVGSHSYLSFDVYFVNETSTELIFSCGRMFPAEEVVSIDWTGEDSDILVTLTKDRKELFSYDSSGQWR